MPKMSQHHQRAHNAFLNLKKPYDATDIYTSMCKLMKLTDEAIERGLGKLFREGKLKTPEHKAKIRHHGNGGGGRGPDED